MAAAALMSAIALGGAYNQAQAAKTQGEFQKDQAEFNARYKRSQAVDVERQGAEQAREAKKKSKSLASSQRAALAAQGVDVNTGSAAEIQAATELDGELDALSIKRNAAKQAYGLEVEAASVQTSGKMAELGGRAEYNNTLLTGGLQAASYGVKASGSSSNKRDILQEKK